MTGHWDTIRRTIPRGRLPIWAVKTGNTHGKQMFPLYPQDRTSLNAVGMTGSCQTRTYAKNWLPIAEVSDGDL
jgi:hypothetical protein